MAERRRPVSGPRHDRQRTDSAGPGVRVRPERNAGGNEQGLAQGLHQPLLIPPLGATAILLLTAPDKPIAQPRAIVGGYLLAVGVAVGCGTWLGTSAWAAAVAAGVAAALMLATDTLHPPGVALLLLLLLAPTPPTWRVLLVPLLPGVGVVLGLGWLFNNVVAGQKYPATTWW